MRVRFAPSPTGFLHIGGLRTALYNYLLARKHGGVFILRIEDTDRSRFVPEAEQDILDCLAWAGLEFDQGPEKEGDCGPYHQSERSALYEAAADALVQSGNAYIAFDTVEEIEAMRVRHRTQDNPSPRYDLITRSEMSNSLTLSTQEVERRIGSGESHVVRLLVQPGKSVQFDDFVRGTVTFESDTLDDQILVKSDGLPTYHLANIVDDHEMGITHVIRGEEWLPSTPKHILLYEALGWTAPAMAHLPLILSPTGGKLSKRSAEKQGIPVTVRQYRDAGYEPQAVVNFLAMLGWNPGDERELFSLDDLTEAFSLERVGQAGVQFDLQKLSWYNQTYLRGRSSADIAGQMHTRVKEKFGECPFDRVVPAIDLMKERMVFAHDILEVTFLFERPLTYDEKSVQKKWKEDSGDLLKSFSAVLESTEHWTSEDLESALKSAITELDIGVGQLMFPVRLALSGLPSGPGLYDMMVYFGRAETLFRINDAVQRLP